MGCWLHKGTRPDQKYIVKEDSKTYSWDNREDINVEDFIIENCEGKEVIKLPGTVNGHQLLIRNCKNSTIFIFDHANSVSVDECSRCKIVFGAVKGSIFLRDCRDCSVLVACGQFRIRDCKRLFVFLLCATQPIIESSSMIHFGCYQLYYKGLEEHFSKAELSVFNNNWSNLHDYTPACVDDERNWDLLPGTIKIEDYITLPSGDAVKSLELSLSNEKSLVPYTFGPNKPSDDESCLVAFFSDGQHEERARFFINTLKQDHPECLLILSREAHLLPDDAKSVFRTTAYDQVVRCGMVVGLHYIGVDSIQSCQKVAMNIATAMGLTGLVYVSNDPRISRQQASDFFKTASVAG